MGPFLRGPERREHLRLCQYGLHGGILEVRWISVFAQNALYQYPRAGTGGISVKPTTYPQSRT